nr:MAG TPA: hypothetical protein [Bacteriophage sp.]
MTELETLSARLEEAVKKQIEADELYKKSAEEVENIKAEMLELKEKTKTRVEWRDDFRTEVESSKIRLQSLCEKAFGENASIRIQLRTPLSPFTLCMGEFNTI